MGHWTPTGVEPRDYDDDDDDDDDACIHTYIRNTYINTYIHT